MLRHTDEFDVVRQFIESNATGPVFACTREQVLGLAYATAPGTPLPPRSLHVAASWVYQSRAAWRGACQRARDERTYYRVVLQEYRYRVQHPIRLLMQLLHALRARDDI